jgi:hypothetical protein
VRLNSQEAGIESLIAVFLEHADWKQCAEEAAWRCVYATSTILQQTQLWSTYIQEP